MRRPQLRPLHLRPQRLELPQWPEGVLRVRPAKVVTVTSLDANLTRLALDERGTERYAWVDRAARAVVATLPAALVEVTPGTWCNPDHVDRVQPGARGGSVVVLAVKENAAHHQDASGAWVPGAAPVMLHVDEAPERLARRLDSTQHGLG